MIVSLLARESTCLGGGGPYHTAFPSSMDALLNQVGGGMYT